MPELPEVETIRRGLSRVLPGRTIAAIRILTPLTASPAAAFFKNALAGYQVQAVNRRGKLLIFALNLGTKGKARLQSEKKFLLLHLKMTGQLFYLDAYHHLAGGHNLTQESVADLFRRLPDKYTRAIIAFKRGGRLFFNDQRRFGYLKLVDEKKLARILAAGYGPEPLTKEFSLEKFRAALKGRRAPIKAVLLNQKLMAGLGNIYADESLFAARLRPNRPAAGLKAAESEKLWRAINSVIKEALKYRGTTFSAYRDASGRPGGFSARLKVYGRAGEKCRVCGGAIARLKIAGRGTNYCPHCQK